MSAQIVEDSIDLSLKMVPPSDDRVVMKWLESQPSDTQPSLTQEIFDDYLAKAAQPRHVSGNACIKLCYYIEQCMKSTSPPIRDTIFADKPCLDLFNFYIEWNEKNQARSMRQVIELISTMIAKNPSKGTTVAIKKAIVDKDMLILTHQAAQPLVKPAFKSLESLMGKGTIHAKDLLDAYQKKPSLEQNGETMFSDEGQPGLDAAMNASPELSGGNIQAGLAPEKSSWDSFFSNMFDWMTYADISPAAGKFLVTVFRDLRTASVASDSSASNTSSWQRWIRRGLGENPEALENVKNYLFPPLFKLDRAGSLSFLDDLSKQGTTGDAQSHEIDTQSLLQLSAMETGKKAGLVEEPDTIEFSKVSKKPSGAVVLQETSIGLLLTHDSEIVRSLAFSVLVSSSSTIRPFSNTTLNVLRTNMYILYCDTDAKFRNEILSSTKHMVERLRGATSLLVKEIESLSFQLNGTQELPTPQHEKDQQRLIAIQAMSQSHDDFIMWYVEFLLTELIPTASYQRHITSLKAILLFLKSGILKQGVDSQPAKTSGNNTVWPYSIDFFTRGCMRLLLDLLLDPFEDVRSGATNILKLASPTSFDLELTDISEVEHNSIPLDVNTFGNKTCEEGNAPLRLLVDFIARAEDISKNTGRADHADGVARSYELLYGLQTSPQSRLGVITQLAEDLERKIEVAERSLGQAVSEAPIHGNFAALTFVWDTVNHHQDFDDRANSELDSREQIESLQQRMSACCFRIWNAVKDILCNDSPEGYFPEELDEVDEVDTKDVLSYSFRAIHESSNLMRSLVNKIKLKLPTPNSIPILPTTTFVQIANLSFDQLSTLRHRGAFSTVASTFAACCQACVHPNMAPESAAFLAKWLKIALECINTQESTTRRSAGIPTLITGILSAKAINPSLEDVVQGLEAIANSPVAQSGKDETQYPQVHALNALKEIVKSAGVGTHVERYIAELFTLGGQSFQSEVFSIKNCGLLLIRSLFDNIFGTNTGKEAVEMGWDGKSTQIDYQRYPALVDLIIDLLKMGTDDALFPAMGVLRRAGPPPAHKGEIESLVTRQLENNHWQVRRIAADCLCSFKMDQKWPSLVVEFLESKSKNTNHRHGQLMVVKAVLKQRLNTSNPSDVENLSNTLPSFRKRWVEDVSRFRCPEILSKHAEIRDLVSRRLCYSATQFLAVQRTLGLNGELSSLQAIDLQSQFLFTTHTTNISSYPALCQCISRNHLYSLAIENNLDGLLPAFTHLMALSTEAAVAFLEVLSKNFENRGNVLVLRRLCLVYVSAMECTVAQIQVAAMQGLCSLLERNFQVSQYGNPNHLIVIDIVLRLDDSRSSAASPALTNAWLGMNSWISLFRILQRMARSSRTFEAVVPGVTIFQSWSLECILNGHENVGFDTRFAAADALSKFYNRLFQALRDIPRSEYLIPSLFGLHTILNDDDSDIRLLASRAISIILRKQIVPQAATPAFADHLLGYYANSVLFIKYVVCKMTGTPTEYLDKGPKNTFALQSVGDQYNEASVGNSSLFAQEKQNLWLDEVQEAKVWSGVFSKLRAPIFGINCLDKPLHPVMSELILWVKKSIIVLKKSSSSPDNSLGWTTKPEVFGVLMRTITTINTTVNYLEEHFLPAIEGHPREWSSTGTDLQKDYQEIIAGLEKFMKQSASNQLHPVLIQALMVRVSKREEVRRQFNTYFQLARRMEALNFSNLTFPLRAGT
ncbi:HEAT repeat protein-like protein [Rhexocercosporidium sp. MPI-PUGE-AT-0058]|nr:HEAT repeat protein-like protein [Rhexocercosporidium sp. MPI-PUGE-AT-0058]